MSRKVKLSKKSSRGRPLVRGAYEYPRPAVRGRPRTSTGVYSARFVPGRTASPLVKYNLLKGNWARPVRVKGKKKPHLVLNPLGAVRRGVGDVWAPIRNQGAVGVAALAVGGGVGFMLPGVVNGLVNRFAPAMVSTGVVGTVVKVLASLMAGSAIYRFAPAGVAKKVGAAVAVGTMGSVILEVAKMVPVLKTVVAGAPTLAGYRGGMGDMVSASQLVQGEAIYRPLSGPVPQSLFAGGLNDFVEFKNQTDGKVAEAFSMVPTSPLAVAPEQF